MADNDKGSYSQLGLFAAADDDADVMVGLDSFGCFDIFNSQFSSPNFGDHHNHVVLVENASTKPAQNGAVACSYSSSSSPVSSTTISNNNNKKKRNGLGKEASSMLQKPSGGYGVAVGNRKNNKKVKVESSAMKGHAKVNKAKLGERIKALQQLVSPYGKTDTASVLHEALGYIRFLHDQVQVLCSPYLQCPPLPGRLHEEKGNGKEEPKKNIRSKGLCLVPVELTSHVENTNGADFWSPAMVNDVSSDR